MPLKMAQKDSAQDFSRLPQTVKLDEKAWQLACYRFFRVLISKSPALRQSIRGTSILCACLLICMGKRLKAEPWTTLHKTQNSRGARGGRAKSAAGAPPQGWTALHAA